MDYLDGKAFLLDIGSLVHQASHVGRDDVLGARIHGVFHFVARHTHRQCLLVHLHGEIGATTHVGLLHLNQFQSSDLRKQLTCFLAETQATQGAAAVVEGHFIGELRTKVVKMHLVDQKIGQFIDICNHPLEIQVVGCVKKEFRIAFLDIMHASGRRRHHGTIV